MIELGVFLPVINNGWALIGADSETSLTGFPLDTAWRRA